MLRRIYKRIHPLTCFQVSRCQEDRNSELNITTKQYLDNHLKVQYHQEFVQFGDHIVRDNVEDTIKMDCALCIRGNYSKSALV